MLIDFYFEGQILFVGYPVKKMFDQFRDVVGCKKWHFLELILSPVFGDKFEHENIDDVHDVANGFFLYS